MIFLCGTMWNYCKPCSSMFIMSLAFGHNHLLPAGFLEDVINIINNVYWVTNAFPVIPVQGGRCKPVAGANHAESAAYIGSCQEEQARDPRARPSWRSHCGAYRREFEAMPTKMRFFESCCPDLIPTQQYSTLHCVHCVSMERLDSQQR